jgi:hypothetical protein
MPQFHDTAGREPTDPTMTTPTALLPEVEVLRAHLEKLRALEIPILRAGSHTAGLDGRTELPPRQSLVLLLDLKALPELRARERLPVFVGVQGGTNVGKSSVFNALSGKLLSPAVVQASSTKHPLVFAHERWRGSFLEGQPFPTFHCQELLDPKELLVDAGAAERLYFRFHGDDAASGLALVDSPDFDSALDSNLEVARRITVLSDLTVFVTTAQKYRDRELVRHLRLVRELKANVVLVFNLVDSEIVFATLLDDLRSSVPLDGGGLWALRIPTFRSPQPEEEMRALLWEPVLSKLQSLEAPKVKATVLHRTLRHVCRRAQDLARDYEAEIAFKAQLQHFTEREIEKAQAAYGSSFSLALPEETVAIRRAIAVTELGPRLRLGTDGSGGPGVLRLLAQGLARVNDAVRRTVLRLARSSEGLVDGGPGALSEYARSRNQADLDNVLRASHSVRLAADGYLRSHEDSSPLARRVLASLFSPQHAEDFPDRVRREFEHEAAASRASGEDIAERVESWIARHPGWCRCLTAAAVLFKLAAGWLLAAALPPAGLFNPWNWLLFALGYLIAAYAMALGITVVLRRSHRFRKARLEGTRAVLERAVFKPLREELDRLLDPGAVAGLSRSASSLEALVPPESPPGPS